MSWCGASWWGLRKSSLITEQLIVAPRHLHWPMEQLQAGLLSFCCWSCIQKGVCGHWLSQAALLLNLSELPARGTCWLFSRNQRGSMMESTAQCDPQSITGLGSSGAIPGVIYWWSKKITSNPLFCSSYIMGSRKRSDPLNPAAVAWHPNPAPNIWFMVLNSAFAVA